MGMSFFFFFVFIFHMRLWVNGFLKHPLFFKCVACTILDLAVEPLALVPDRGTLEYCLFFLGDGMAMYTLKWAVEEKMKSLS